MVQLFLRWKGVNPEPVATARYMMWLEKPERFDGLFEEEGVGPSQTSVTSLLTPPAY